MTDPVPERSRAQYHHCLQWPPVLSGRGLFRTPAIRATMPFSAPSRSTMPRRSAMPGDPRDDAVFRAACPVHRIGGLLPAVMPSGSSPSHAAAANVAIPVESYRGMIPPLPPASRTVERAPGASCPAIETRDTTQKKGGVRRLRRKLFPGGGKPVISGVSVSPLFP